jgi:putative aminopeptidase FrvX
MELSTTIEKVINGFEIKGVISKSEKGQTKNGLDFHNILVEVKGKKYTDFIPLVAYGEFIIPGIGMEVVVFGRIRSKEFDLKYSPTLIVESIHRIVDEVEVKI